jgi:pimeloyl-ACP methyl ester carboxylesterase
MRAMAQAIPGAHLATVPHAGHVAPMEQPVNTARLIGEFLNALP